MQVTDINPLTLPSLPLEEQSLLLDIAQLSLFEFNDSKLTVTGKICCRCHSRFEDIEANFNRNRAMKDGFAYWCKACNKASKKATQQRKAEAKASRKPIVKGKVCSRCRVNYEDMFANFHQCKMKKDGFQNQCKTCRQVGAIERWKKPEVKAKAKAFYEKNKDKKKAYDTEYRKHNIELRREQNREYQRTRADAIKAKAKEYAQNNRERRRKTANAYVERNRDKVYAANRLYASRNPDKRAAIKARRRSREVQACPKWITTKATQAFYTVAREMTRLTGISYHVDHIDPLGHSLVCGLHVPANLRVVKGSENFVKNNKFQPYRFDGHYYKLPKS